VIVEYWTGERWRYTDAQLDPARDWGVDPADLPHLVGAKPDGTPPFATAAQVWTAYRRGEIDADNYGVGPDAVFQGSPLRGARFVSGYVLQELAHRQRDELLLWDVWGAMAKEGTDPVLCDEIAALLLAADDGAADAERELAGRYTTDPRLNPGGRVRCLSPTGTVSVIDLRSREPLPGPGEADVRD
jgi:hypothetical protein